MASFEPPNEEHLSKEEIADLSIRISYLADGILNQIHKAKIALRERFFIGILERQQIILRDIHNTLKSNPTNTLTTPFILFRCLLDDFIKLLYVIEIGTDGKKITFTEDRIIRSISSSYSDRFKMYEESEALNKKYFEGKNPQLPHINRTQEEKSKFIADPQNKIYLDENGRFIKSPSTKEIVSSFPVNDTSKANAHAFIVWKYLSNYVHYSIYEYQVNRNSEARIEEIQQLREVLSYCYKATMICSNALDHFGIKNEFKDPSNIAKELFLQL